MYASLNGAVKVCRERRTHPNLVYHCPWCDTSYSGPLPSTCRCGAVFSAEAPLAPFVDTTSQTAVDSTSATPPVTLLELAPTPAPVPELAEPTPFRAPKKGRR